MSDETLRAELRAKHGDECAAVERAKHGLFVFAKPTAVVYTRFRQKVTQKGVDSGAVTSQLCTDCLVYPTGPSGDPDYTRCSALFEAYPGLPDSIGAQLVKLAGAGDGDDVGVGKL